MKNNVGISGITRLMLVLLFAFSTVSFVAAGEPGNMQMMLESESRYGFDKTVELFEKNVKTAGWSVVGVYDYKEILEAKGFDILNIKIIALCSGKHSAAILSLDDERIVSPLMPCTISIYEKSNGKTYITRLNSGAVAAPFGGVIADTMLTVAGETEGMVKNLIR